MTRINCIPPQELTSKHLLAEYRELPRIIKLAKAAQARGEVRAHKRTDKYTLGEGHLKFFYNKLFWCHKRWKALAKELQERNYNLDKELMKEIDNSFKSAPVKTYGDWHAPITAMNLNRRKLKEKINVV